MKQCNKCKIEKNSSEFNKCSKCIDGLQNRCKLCNSENLKKHYHNNLLKYQNKNKKRKEVIRKYVNSFKIKCSKCDESHIACLDFHHLTDKEINIAQMQQYMWSNNRIKKELDKCIVLCSNCHRKLHYNEKHFQVV